MTEKSDINENHGKEDTRKLEQELNGIVFEQEQINEVVETKALIVIKLCEEPMDVSHNQEIEENSQRFL